MTDNNGQMKIKDKRTNDDLKTSHRQLKIEQHESPQKPVVELMCFRGFAGPSSIALVQVERE